MGRSAKDQWETRLPPLFDMPGADQPIPLRQAINHYASDNAWVPDMLAGRTMEEVGRNRFDGDLLGSNPRGNLESISAAACDAARRVSDRDAIVHCSYGDVRARALTSGCSESNDSQRRVRHHLLQTHWRADGGQLHGRPR